MLSQHYSDFLVSTIKSFLKYNLGAHAYASLLILHFKELDLFVSNLSFGGTCSNHLSGHPLCKKEVYRSSERHNIRRI